MRRTKYSSVLNNSLFENNAVRQNKFLAAPLIAGAASAAGGAAVNGILGGGGKGTGYQAERGVTGQQAQAQLEYQNQTSGQQQALLQAIQAQGGLQKQNDVYNQFANTAAGTGPNPAMAALANATGQNVSNQAALMAGQRGASSNVGLIARQAAQQGAGIQQQSAGQGALLQAQQSLAAQQQQAALANQMAAQQQNQTNANNQSAIQQESVINNQLSNQNNANASIQKQVAQGQIGAVGGLAGGIGALGTALGGAIGGGGGGGSAPAASVQQAPQAAQGPNLMGGLQFAHGGIIPGPRSRVGRHLKGMQQVQPPGPMQMPMPLAHGGGTALSGGGKVPAMVSPGEVYLPPQKAKEVAKDKKNPISEGKKIPGKAEVKGDSKKNDKVPALLESGGVVIPRSIIMAKDDPEGKAAKFVQAVIAKHGLKKKLSK